MKVIPIALAAHYALPTTTLAAFFEIQRSDGVYARFTGADHAVTVDGGVYLSAHGLDISDLHVSSGGAVDAMNLTILPDADIPEDDLLSGLWDNCQFRLFEANYLSPADGINLIRRGWTGDVQVSQTGYVLELRSLKQALQQSIGAVTSKTCRARLGDELCKVDLGPWTHTYPITAVASRRVFTASAAIQVDDDYGEGTAKCLTGLNAGYTRKVKAFTAGVFTMALEFPYTIQVGDSFTFVAGCRKRLLEDCKAKFNNVLNNQSEPHVPGADAITADPEV